MRSADEYRELARECMRDADQSQNAERKQTLLAKLYEGTALKVERDNSVAKKQRNSGSMPTVG